jgi:hypothetical protein
MNFQNKQMTQYIHEDFYGKNCPITALSDSYGTDKFQLPLCVDENAINVLKSVVGCGNDFRDEFMTEDIEKWFVHLDLYFDIPLLGVLGSNEIDFESVELWEKLLPCSGLTRFLSNFTCKLNNNNTKNTISVLFARHGYVDGIKWLIKNKSFYEINNIFSHSCNHGQLECAKWCVENGAIHFNRALNNACLNGHLDCAKLCEENGANDFNCALNFACENGHMEIVKFCVEKGANEFNVALYSACLNGHLECVKFCVENGANEFNSALYYANRYNQTDCVDYVLLAKSLSQT